MLTAKGEDVITLGIFSKIPEEISQSWIKIDGNGPDFYLTGLKKTSVIKTEKITVLHRSLIKRELGHLSTGMFKQVKRTLVKTLEIE